MDNESDPLYQEALATFRNLLDEARASDDPEPTAMTLATFFQGRVSARIVLLKRTDDRGFQFFTNYESAKGVQLIAHPQVALCFHWKRLRKQVQVRIEGRAEKLSASESDVYFATRARGSQIGAWASRQSQPLAGREEFDARLADVEALFGGIEVSRPPHWGGFVVVPDQIEFWYGAGFRLHERRLYEREEGGGWRMGLLYP